MLESRIYQGRPPARVAAFPDELNPLHWKGVVETDNFYATADLDLTGDFDPGRATYLIKPDPDPAIDAAGRTRAFGEFRRFAQFPFLRVLPVPEPEGAREVLLVDLRFATFQARAVVDSRQRVVSQDFRWNAGRWK
jgi:hypothetical protein